MTKTKILFVLIQLNAGGSERVVLNLARNLDPHLFEIYIAAFSGGELEDSFREVCEEIFFISKRRRVDLLAMLRIASIIKQKKIDVVNAHHYMPCLYSFLPTTVLHRKKLIYTEHSVPEVIKVAEGRHGRILNLMFPRLHSVIGVSEEITDTFKSAYPRYRNKFHTVLNCVDIEKYSDRRQRSAVRQRFGFTEEQFIVGTVANFRRVKNHACLVKAAARLKNAHPTVCFLLVGTGFPGDAENTEGEIRDLIAQFQLEDRVLCAGYQEDIPAILSALDCFCLPSFSEGLPVSILEAMAAGLPILGSNVSGIKEVVENGHTGLLFSSDNDQELAELIGGIARDPDGIETIIENIKIKIEQEYNMKSWVRTMSRFYRNAGP